MKNIRHKLWKRYVEPVFTVSRIRWISGIFNNSMASWFPKHCITMVYFIYIARQKSSVWISDEEQGCAICLQSSLMFLGQFRKRTKIKLSVLYVKHTFAWFYITHKCQCLFPKRRSDLCNRTVQYVMLLFNKKRCILVLDTSV